MSEWDEWEKEVAETQGKTVFYQGLEWVRVPKKAMRMPDGLKRHDEVMVVLLMDVAANTLEPGRVREAGDWSWDVPPEKDVRIVMWRKVDG